MTQLTKPDFQTDVPAFYLRHNRDQSLERSRELRSRYAARVLGRATVRERFSSLADIRDESDSDLEGMSQLGHALQTANAMQVDGLGEDWLVLGLIHDVGKILLQYGELPEFVVGDTFPVGCAYSPRIQHADYLALNPDAQNAELQTPCGIYEAGCGLEQVEFAYGHDEYLYTILKDNLPHEIAWTIRHHSFQSVADDYTHLFDERDRALRESHLRVFARYDLYTKDPDAARADRLDEFLELLDRWFPEPIEW
jgi:inositol oxygenase